MKIRKKVEHFYEGKKEGKRYLRQIVVKCILGSYHLETD